MLRPRAILVIMSAALLTLAFGNSGCATAPTPEQLAMADYGDPPDQYVVEPIARRAILDSLKDPNSAIINFSPIQKAWFREFGRPNRFAWRLTASVNARNSFGGYTGAKPWYFFFRGNELVGLGMTDTHYGQYGPSTYLNVVESRGVYWPPQPWETPSR
jgi:hypothetical protein